MVLYKLYGY